MSISIASNLMGAEKSKSEGIKFSDKKGDLKIGIVNLMPFKDETEYQFFNVLGRYRERVEVEFLYPFSHTSKNSSMDYIRDNYYPLSDITHREYHGIIVTGAPVEDLPFEEVSYWEELDNFIKANSTPCIYICWGAQSALYSKYGIDKHPLDKKLFGVYEHKNYSNPFISKDFLAPHSRNTYNKKECIEDAGLKVLNYSDEAGVYICSSSDYRDIFISGHGEYQKDRLKYEYDRDKKNLPYNYFPEDDPSVEPVLTWDSHREEFYKKWLDFIRSRG